MKNRVEWETLNAYVDGELAPASMARVAEAVAADPELARQMAELHKLKSALFNSRPDRCPPMILETKSTGRRPLVAAAVLLLSMLGGLLAGALFLEKNNTPEQLQQAVAAHQTWRNAEPADADGNPGILLKSSLDRLQLDAYIPDLSHAGLRYDGIRRISSTAGRGLHVGYRGAHGCRVSLIVFPGAGQLPEEITTFDSASGLAYGWQVRSNAFYLLAPRMDPERLRQVARAIHRMTRAYTPMDRGTTLALNQAREQSRPCSV